MTNIPPGTNSTLYQEASNYWREEAVANATHSVGSHHLVGTHLITVTTCQ